MGTDYKLYKDNSFGELTIDEMSNKLSFNLFSEDLNLKGFDPIITSNEMFPEEMAKIMLKGLTVCSYWMDTDKLKALIKEHVDKEIY